MQAKIIIWDYEKREMSASYEIHKVRVDDMCFTAGGEYLVSLGGRDDGRIIIWDVRKQSPLSGKHCVNIVHLVEKSTISTNRYKCFARRDGTDDTDDTQVPSRGAKRMETR